MNIPEVRLTTIVFPLDGNKVLLGMKKRGFGAGWWNGFGGKLEPGESFESSAIRETQEEVELSVKDLKPIAYLLFHFDGKPEIACVAYSTDNYEGEPVETEEMRPKWFSLSELPYETMWPGDRTWVSKALGNNLPIYQSQFFTSDTKFLKAREESAETIGRYFNLP